MENNKNSSPLGLKRTSGDKDDNAASRIFEKLILPATPEASTINPVSGLDEEVAKIFQQASEHRDRLVKFFVRYTWVFSLFVAVVITGQALARAFIPGGESIELVPHWVLNLLVVGLVGQFITLLTIVTKKVWLFEEFFRHADATHLKTPEQTGSTTEK